MLQVHFSTKVQRVYRADGTIAYEYLRIPARARDYVDMHSIGALPDTIRLDDIPNDVTVNVSENFATVIIDC